MWCLEAAPFDSGSTGADGPLVVTGNTNLVMPPNGIFNFTTVMVTNNATVTFTKNSLNTPVYFLASGNVVINGTIDVSGSPGGANFGGQGGPGGFGGGAPGAATDPPGDGLGPGGGKGGDSNPLANFPATGGAFGGISAYSSTNRYGNLYLQPLVGGSGGGGTQLVGTGINPYNFGGGGGGGAILIASSTQISILGSIRAGGGSLTPLAAQNMINGGSGGAIRLVAPVVAGNGYLAATAITHGGFNGGPRSQAGDGRIRIDTLDTSGIIFSITGRSSVGSNMSVFPRPMPRLDIISVGNLPVPTGTNTLGNGVIVVTFPLNSPTNQTVAIQATDFVGPVSVEVAVSPLNGPSQRFLGSVDLTNTNQAIANVSVVIPTDIPCRIDAWTR